MFQFKTIRTKITVTIFSVFLFFLLVHISYEYYELKNKEFAILKSVNKTINKMLVEYTSAYIFNNDIENIQLTIDAIDTIYVKSISILDKDGIVLAQNHKKSLNGKRHKRFEKLLLSKNNTITSSDEYIVLNRFDILDVPIGYLVVEANLEIYKDNLQREKLLYMGEIVIFSFMLLIIAMHISRNISQPIEDIVRRLEDTKDNDILTIPDQTQQEFQYLSTKISDKHNTLIKLNVKLQTIFDMINDGIAILDVHGNIIFVNDSFSVITGYEKDKLLDMMFYDFIEDEHLDDVLVSYKNLLLGHTHIFLEDKIVIHDEKKIDIVANLDVMPDRKSVMLIIRDVSKKKMYKRQREEQEKQLIQQSRMAQMGEMISMIAHQWRQPLSSISATAINLRLKIELGDFDLESKDSIKEFNDYFLENLEEIESYTQSLTTTIDDFRNFYKPNKNLVTVSINNIIKKSLSIIKASLVNDNIKIIQEYDTQEEIKVYDNELMQVLLNIFKNAQDNFKEKDTQGPEIVIKSDDKTITICDNGGGINNDIIEKIFDPYFSTKDEKNGTGLGLYMSKTIIEEHHNGKLGVSNLIDENGNPTGVCFKIELSGELSCTI